MAVFRSVDLIYPDGTGIRLSKVCGLCTLSILIPVLPKWIGSTDLKTAVLHLIPNHFLIHSHTVPFPDGHTPSTMSLDEAKSKLMPSNLLLY